MNLNKLLVRLKNSLFFAVFPLLMLSFSSCPRTIFFLTSSVVPAAEGVIRVKEDNNGNYVIRMQINNLAEPERLLPPRNAYVVWILSDQKVVKSVGQVRSSAHLLSDGLTASFEAVSAIRPVKLFITAEENATVEKPGKLIVLTTEVF